MASAATDVVSLDEIKHELRLGGETEESRTQYTEQDSLLTGHIAAACSFVSREVGMPLVDVTDVVHVPRPGAHDPVAFRALAVRSVEAVDYWTPDGALRNPPDGVAIGDELLGRLVSDDRNNVLFPPSDGWPEILTDSLLQLTIKRGIAITAETVALKQSVILCVRQFYDGYREIRPTEAFFSLIQPWRRYD